MLPGEIFSQSPYLLLIGQVSRQYMNIAVSRLLPYVVLRRASPAGIPAHQKHRGIPSGQAQRYLPANARTDPGNHAVPVFQTLINHPLYIVMLPCLSFNVIFLKNWILLQPG
jgi:hypothetical protein